MDANPIPKPVNKVLNHNFQLDIVSKLWQRRQTNYSKSHNLPIGVSDFS